MKNTLKALVLLTFLFGSYATILAQGKIKQQTLANPDNEPRDVFPLPTESQMMWQETEFYGFFHYGINTFVPGDNEWGSGKESPKTYAPTTIPNCLQWVQTAKKAGMKGGIAVVKHHDGFCLWPTKSTDYNILQSGGVGPQVDIPQLFVEASEAENMKYGFYISPWDKNNAYYGKEQYVRDVFLKQATELASYGKEQFEMWFDGANGGSGYYGGANETRKIDADIYYDMPNLRDSVHKLQPNCVMWGIGGEARWIGNEAGYAQIENWSGVLVRGNEFGAENGVWWSAGEADTKATNQGWFWNEGENALSKETLYKMYLETIGRNATFILNLPPNKYGVLPEKTVNALEGLGQLLKERLTTDLTSNATVTVSGTRTAGANRNYVANNLIDGDKNTYWTVNDGIKEAIITLTWDNPIEAHYVMLQEFIRKGQRVKAFKVETSEDGTNWVQRASNLCKTIGYKRIIPFNGRTDKYLKATKIKAVKITITDSKSIPLLHTISIF